MLKIFITTLLFLFFNICKTEKNNVCKSMCDYEKIEDSENCWYNPDVGGSPKEIITRRGYPFETYTVTTQDGYINVLFRIPHNNTDKNETRQPILLRGGLGGGPQSFLYIGNRSLAFFLVNNGFDVWLANPRGFSDNNGHRVYNKKNKEFWDFSFHETGYFDIKAEINFISKKTKGRRKVVLLGYSMGTTETYVYAVSRQKQVQKNIAGIISLSPIAFMERSGGIIAKLAKYAGLIENFLRQKNVHVLYLGSNSTENLRYTYENLILTKTLLSLVVGKDSLQIQSRDFPVYLRSKSSPVTVKCLVHFAQEIKADGKFQHFDYGSVKNFKLYKSAYPPVYNLSKIQVPVHLFYGEGDLLSDKKDVLRLYSELTIENKSLTCIPENTKIKFNHIDFTLAKDIQKFLYDVLLKTIKENMRV